MFPIAPSRLFSRLEHEYARKHAMSGTAGEKRPREGADGGPSKKAKGDGGAELPKAAAPKVQTQLSFGGLVEMIWQHPSETLFYGTTKNPPEPSSKIAGIDLDGALINTKSGARHGKDAGDWKWFDSKVPAKVRECHSNGFRIVLFTNQGGLRQQAADSTNVMAFKSKLRQIATQLKVPITALVATNYDWNRKPGTGMLEFLLSNLNDGIDIDRAESFFVGDAAGRIAGWKPGASKDFSDSDRKFALNAGIPFYTPEEFFKCEPATTKFTLSGFDPRPLLTQSFDPYPPDFFNPPKPGQQEIVVLVGRPGAGKTTVAQKFFPRHVWVNQDTLKTKEKCAKVVEDEIRIGRSVVVDNTNPSKGVRNTYIELGFMRGIPVRCIWFTAPEDLCIHNNGVRAAMEGRKSLPMSAWAGFRTNFQEPTLDEGFAQVLKLDFRPTFEDEVTKERWFKFQMDPPKQW